MLKTAPLQPRAHGAVRLSVKRGPGGGTALNSLRPSGALKALFPRPQGSALEAVLVNTAGGVTGGDSFSGTFHAEAGTALTLTTQTAERGYRALPNEVAELQTHITAGHGAHVQWLPQETILFQGAAINRRLRVELAAKASFLMVEPLVFGRAAMGEVLTEGRFTDRIEIYRDGQIAYLDGLSLRGNISAQLAHAHIGGGAGAMASLVYIAPDAEARLTPLRALLGPLGGVSLRAPDMLVLRCMAPDSYLLRKTLIPALALLTDHKIPRCWIS